VELLVANASLSSDINRKPTRLHPCRHASHATGAFEAHHASRRFDAVELFYASTPPWLHIDAEYFDTKIDIVALLCLLVV